MVTDQLTPIVSVIGDQEFQKRGGGVNRYAIGKIEKMIIAGDDDGSCRRRQRYDVVVVRIRRVDGE